VATLLRQAERVGLSDAWLYAVKTTIAALLALYIAYAMEFDTPFQAVTTVVIVANPMQGMAFKKGACRAVGTIVGAAAVIALTSAFGQQPELFLFGLGLWIGLCAMVSTLLSGFRSLGAVMAAITAGFVAFPGLPSAPDAIFTLVVARVLTVLTGIVCSAVVSSLLTPRTGADDLESRLRDCLADICDFVRSALDARSSKDLLASQKRVRAKIAALDGLVEYAVTEGSRSASVLEAHRGSVVAMLASLTTALSIQSAASSSPPPPNLQELNAELHMLGTVLRHIDSTKLQDSVTAGLSRLAKWQREIEDDLRQADLVTLRLIGRLEEMLNELGTALRGLVTLLNGKSSSELAVRPSFHRNWRWAATNGLKSALAIWLAGALWIVTAWPTGTMMIGAMVPVLSLVMLRDRPDCEAFEFGKGIVLAAALGLFYIWFVLPSIEGFPLLAIALGIVLTWALRQTINPERIFFGYGVATFFIQLMAPTNAMTFDIANFINLGTASIAAAFLATLVHRAVFPFRPLTHVRLLIRDIRNDPWRIARFRRIPSIAWGIAWETRMHDRLLKLANGLKAAGVPGDSLMHDAHAALHLGHEMLRLRGLLTELDSVPSAVSAGRAVLRSLAAMPVDPRRTVRLCRQAAARMIHLATGQSRETAADLGRGASALIEIALLVGRHRRFFLRSSQPC
jgi:uncharacterized membrane protein YccC